MPNTNYVSAARQVLARAESELRELMAQALNRQQYEPLAGLASLATAIAKLAEPLPESRPLVDVEGMPPTSVASQTRPPDATDESRENPAPYEKVARRGSRASFPRFERDQDRLIKIGWSKKDKQVYEHRAPRGAVSMVFANLMERSERTGQFRMEEVLPIKDADGAEIPSYQVYLALAWLRDAGAIERRGNDGYVARLSETNANSFNNLWDATPERR